MFTRCYFHDRILMMEFKGHCWLAYWPSLCPPGRPKTCSTLSQSLRMQWTTISSKTSLMIFLKKSMFALENMMQSLFPFFISVQQSLAIHLKATPPTTIIILPLSKNATNNGNNNDNLGLDDPTIKPEELHETTRTKAPWKTDHVTIRDSKTVPTNKTSSHLLHPSHCLLSSFLLTLPFLLMWHNWPSTTSPTGHLYCFLLLHSLSALSRLATRRGANPSLQVALRQRILAGQPMDHLDAKQISGLGKGLLALSDDSLDDLDPQEVSTHSA